VIIYYRPIKKWPEGWAKGLQIGTIGSPFSSPWSSTLTLLGRELDMLGVDEATLQVDTAERNCRADGGLRRDARIDYHGVILTLDSPEHGRLTYPCNAFVAGMGNKESWRENVRAIALGLESLRRVERYGIANRGEQYAGFAELPSGIALGAAPMMMHEASIVLAEGTGLLQMDGGDLMDAPHKPNERAVRDAFRQAAKLHHPDNGGDVETFKRIVQAYEVLLDGST
jgi:hypothetical protein